METDAIECYYCAWVTDDLQTCVNYVVIAHGDKLLKVKTPALGEKSGTIGMKSKNLDLFQMTHLSQDSTLLPTLATGL